jgi:outer membrane biosynthesis protein TonB
MSLRLVDKYVREGNFAQALGELAKARHDQPGNPYILAYEERIMTLLKEKVSEPQEPRATLVPGGYCQPPETTSGLPSVEGQLHAIAHRVQMQDTLQPGPDPDRERKNQQHKLALLARISEILENASRYLGEHQFDRALEEIGRAMMLDPGNADIIALEQKITAAHEDARDRLEQDRQREEQTREEEERRRAQEEKKRREEEQRQLREQEEQARRKAQQEKFVACLQHTRRLIGDGLLIEAQAELAFALVLEPGNEEARGLSREITHLEEEQRQAEAERRRREEEARRREEEEREQEAERLLAIATAIEDADQLLEEARFGEALTTVTRAYMLDPTSPDLRACEERILQARDLHAQREEERRRAKEEQERRERDERLRHEAEEEERRALAARVAEQEQRRRELAGALAVHLTSAREFLHTGALDRALAETAQAFLIDPFNEEVKLLEQRVLLARVNAQSRREAAHIPADPEPAPLTPDRAPAADPHPGGGEHGVPEETVHTVLSQEQDLPPVPATKGIPESDDRDIHEHLVRARRHATRKNFPAAFDEIGKAFILDPMCLAVQSAESEIQRLFVEHEEIGACIREEEIGARVQENESVRRSVAPTPLLMIDEFRTSKTTDDDTGMPEEPGARRISPKRKRRLVLAAVTPALLLVATGVILTSGTRNEPAPDRRDEPASSTSAVERNPATQSLEQSPRKSNSRPTAARHSETHFSPAARPAQLEPEPVPETRLAESRPEQPMTPDTPAEGTSGTRSADLGIITVPEAADEERTSDSGTGDPPEAKPPAIVRLEKPRIPDHALRSGFPEEVVVSVEIGPGGSPLRTRVVRSTNPFLTEPVVDAVMNSTYTPGLSGGSPQSAWLTIPFHLKK